MSKRIKLDTINPFDLIPNEILRKIFKFFKRKPRTLAVIAMTCRRFRDCADDLRNSYHEDIEAHLILCLQNLEEREEQLLTDLNLGAFFMQEIPRHLADRLKVEGVSPSSPIEVEEYEAADNFIRNCAKRHKDDTTWFEAVQEMKMHLEQEQKALKQWSKNSI